MSTRIKVLECIRQGKIGGGESHLLNLVETIDKGKFEPIVLSFTEGPMVDRLQQFGIETTVIHTERPFDFRCWGSVRKFLQQKSIQIIHAHGTRAASNIIWAAGSLKIPVVYTIHGWSFHPDQPRLTHKLRILGEAFITARTAVNISVSKANQQLGREYVKGFNSIIVNYGIDQKKFTPAGVVKNVRAELGIADQCTLILFIARFTKQKQPLAMIQAFCKATQQMQGLHLLMVGDGDLKQEALALARNLSLQHQITFQAFRQDVPEVLAAADIFALPSLWEGLPIGLLEAMAMGKAVVATNVDGTGEVLRNEENGLLIGTTHMVDELAAALIRLAQDRELRKKFEKKAVETINEEFNVHTMTRNIENIYCEITNKSTQHGI